jgi:hypothetical protein
MSAKHNDLVKKIRLFLSENHILSIDTPTPGILYTKAGVPVRSTGKGKLDIHACAPIQTYDKDGTQRKTGLFIAIDAKIGKDKLKTEQLAYSKAVERHGGIAFAAYSVQDVYDILIQRGILDRETAIKPRGD